MANSDSVTVKRGAALLLAAALAGPLAGCAMSDDTMERFLVAPDKYMLYNCADLAAEAKTAAARERDLVHLMAQASTDSAGRLISAIAYQPDYIQVRGELNELRQAQVAKKCGEADANDAGRMSDAVIR